MRDYTVSGKRKIKWQSICTFNLFDKEGKENMIKLDIAIDEKKIEKAGFTCEDIEMKISEIINRHGIFKRDENGVWVENGDKYDYARFGKIILELKEQDWFFRFVKRCIWNVDGEKNNVIRFYKQKENGNELTKETKEKTTMIKMEITLNAKAIEKAGFTCEDIEIKISEIMNRHGIFKKDEKGVWIENGDKYDYARFGKIILEFKEQDWFFRFVKRCIWNVGGEKNNVIRTFKQRGYGVTR